MATETEIDWELTSCHPGLAADPEQLGRLALEWLPAEVPGTAASALRALGRWDWDDRRCFDDDDWWWRGRFPRAPGPGPWLVHLEGLATLADVWINGIHRLRSESMWLPHELVIEELDATSNEILIRCEALTPLLKVRRKPRPRWRTRLVADQNLRWFRTTLLGRMPGWSPRPAPVGPWRRVEVETTPAVRVVGRRLEPTCVGSGGRLKLDVTLKLTVPLTSDATVVVGDVSAALEAEPTVDGARIRGTIDLAAVSRWWPHTHGNPTLYPVELRVEGTAVSLGAVGFRTIDAVSDDGGFALIVNGVRIFCRGACWTPTDAVRACSPEASRRASLEAARDAGMNMMRVTGTMTYEDDGFYDACDELGMLVWQDLMFANLDYPTSADFTTLVVAEVEQVLERLRARPSTAVLCGGSEVQQQAAMMGLAPEEWRSEVFDELLPNLVAEGLPGVPWLVSSPSGGPLPFHVNEGVAHYFGVGAYLRPLDDARTSGVRFASECLAFANVPDRETVEELLGSAVAPHHPRWKERVPRDNGAGWDFEDVRDHYLGLLYGVDPLRLRYSEPDRYLELSRQVTGEVMSATFAEWRRPGSLCGGGIVLMLRDLWPGAGWGLIDSEGHLKDAMRALAPTLAPVGVLVVDEGLNGLYLHIVNDTPESIHDDVVVEVDGPDGRDRAECVLDVGPRSSRSVSIDGLIGRFRDVGWVYRFGPPTIDTVTVRFGSRTGHWRRLRLR